MLLTQSRIYYESAQQQQPFAAMTPGSGNSVFLLSAKPWSSVAGYEYVVAPYGLMTGGAVTAASANNEVDVAALTAMMPGATGASPATGSLTVAAATGVSITRGAASNTHTVTAITVTSAGAIAAVAGTAGTSFSSTRGAAGGPPFIPVGSIEIAHVSTSSAAAAPVAAGEISQVVGVSQERSAFPVMGNVDAIRGKVEFASSLPPIHTGGVPKLVYARVATPVFAEIGPAKDWVPAEASSSVSSDDYYEGPRNSVSSSVGQASFTAVLQDGVTDAILSLDGENLMFRFKPDRDRGPYQITQGIFRKTRSFAVGGEPGMSATISAASATVDFAS